GGDATHATSDSRTSVDAMTEAKAIADVVEALKHLDAAAIGRVLDWASKRYGARAGADHLAPREGSDTGSSEGDVRADGRHADLAELYTVADPKTESE